MDSTDAPPVVPEPDWTPVDPFATLRTDRSFMAGDRLRVSYFRRQRDNVLVGRAWFGPRTEGPPGCAHGGSTAAVLDDVLTAAAMMAGHVAIAVRLTVDFRRLVPIGTDTTFEAWVEPVEGRHLRARARLLMPAGEVAAEGEALFVTVAGR